MAIRAFFAGGGPAKALGIGQAAARPVPRAEARRPRRVGSGAMGRRIILIPLQRPTEVGTDRIHETWVMNRLSEAKQTAEVVANRGVGWAGKVAMVASPTRNTSKSCDRFL